MSTGRPPSKVSMEGAAKCSVGVRGVTEVCVALGAVVGLGATTGVPLAAAADGVLGVGALCCVRGMDAERRR